MSEREGLSTRVVVAIVNASTRRPLVAVVALLALAGLSAWYAAGNLGINTDTANMISPELPWRRDFIAYRESFPVRDQNIVAVVDGPDGEASMQHARALAAALRREPDLFISVFLAGDGEFFEKNGLLYLPLDELEALADRLIEAQPLLARLAANAGGAGILSTLTLALGQGGDLAPQARADVDRILAELAATIEAANAGAPRAIAWGGLLGVNGQLAPRQLILIKPRLDFAIMRPAREAIERIRAIDSELAAADGVTVRLTGTLAMEHEELTSVASSARATGIASVAAVVIVVLWALRSVRGLVVAMITLAAGLCMTAAFAAAAVGHLNLLSVAFAVLYVGLGIDFILHIMLRLKEERASTAGVDAALLETARGIGSSLGVCAVTTAVGFFAFVPTDFDGVSELGLISGVGIFISLAVSLTLLPALLKLTASRRDGQHAHWQARGHGLNLPALPPRLTVGLAAAAVLVSLFLLPGLRFDGNPIRLRDPDSESIRALDDLAAESSAPLFNLAVLVPDSAAAGAAAARLAPLATVARVLTVDSLVPTDQAEKLLVLEDLELVLGTTLAGLAADTADPQALPEALAALATLLDAGPDQSVAARAYVAAARSWLDAARVPPGDGAGRRASVLDAAIRGNLFEQLARLRTALDAGIVARSDLPSALTERWVNQQGEELVEVVPSENLNDSAAAGRFVSEVRGVMPNATGLPVVYEEASATVTRAFTFALSLALAAVSIVLLLSLRSLRDTLLVLAPVAFAATVTSGACVLIGMPLNFANIIALPLLVGVGVDSGVHIVHRMKSGSSASSDSLRSSTSRAVFASAVTTVASFGNLAFATHYGMASMGQLLTLGMLASLVGALCVLPSLVRLVRAA